MLFSLVRSIFLAPARTSLVSNCTVGDAALSPFRRGINEIINPRRTRFRKAPRGKIPVPIGGSLKGTTVVYGTYGLAVDHGTRLNAKQLESARRLLKRVMKRVDDPLMKLRVFPDIPFTRKPPGSRMGNGKGDVDHYECRVAFNRVIFEIGGPNLREDLARAILFQVSTRLPVACHVTVYDPTQPAKLPALCNLPENKGPRPISAQRQIVYDGPIKVVSP